MFKAAIAMHNNNADMKNILSIVIHTHMYTNIIYEQKTSNINSLLHVITN